MRSERLTFVLTCGPPPPSLSLLLEPDSDSLAMPAGPKRAAPRGNLARGPGASVMIVIGGALRVLVRDGWLLGGVFGGGGVYMYVVYHAGFGGLRGPGNATALSAQCAWYRVQLTGS